MDMPVIIQNDNGGVVEDYERRVGRAYVIDGPCKSACTIYMASPNLCVTPRAEFWFHRAFDGYYISGQPVVVRNNPALTREMIGYYPPNVQWWVAQHGGLTGKWLVLKGREMLRMFRRCS